MFEPVLASILKKWVVSSEIYFDLSTASAHFFIVTSIRNIIQAPALQIAETCQRQRLLRRGRV